MQKETSFKLKVKARLANIPNAYFIKIQMLSIRGIPDFLGVKDGRFVALELKTEDGSTDGLQRWTLKKLANCGAFVKVVTPSNLDETIEQIRGL